QLLPRAYAELGEAPGARQNHPLERPDSAVVGLDPVAERLADLKQVRRKRVEPLVELRSELADLGGVLGERDLLPSVRDRLQQRYEARRRRQNDVLPQRVVEQRGALR